MHFDSTDNPVFINKQIHKNAQATTVLLASLCGDEYNKVSGLDNAKKIWDTLKISHEGNDATMITKMELVEGELGRFAMIRGEKPTQTYNRLKTLINKIQSYGSTRWTDHDVVRLMVRSFTVIDPHLVNLICENPRYTKMTPKEILRKFVSGRMMVKEARYVDDALNGPLPIYEPQHVALKATSSKEALPSKVAQVEAAGLNEDEMALIIKRFKTALKGRKEYPSKNKTRGKRSCFKCSKTDHFIAQCPDNDNDQEQEKYGKREKKKVYKKAKGEAHLGKEWDSDCSSSDSDDEGLTASAFNKSYLFPNERHTCLMAKEKKVSVGVSRPGGSLSRRVNVAPCPSPDGSSARPSAKGGKRGGRRLARERWESRDLRVRPTPRSGALAVGGYKRPRGRGSERLQASACLVLVPAWPTFSKRALVLPFIGVRRGSRCTTGGYSRVLRV
jgi:hypothetical protein